MPYKRKIKNAVRRTASISAWRTRLVFWAGAAFVGLCATLLAQASSWADALFHTWVARWGWLPL
ncbi:MAG: chloride channel protein, partial [Gammaproteobacteria bacterium]